MGTCTSRPTSSKLAYSPSTSSTTRTPPSPRALRHRVIQNCRLCGLYCEIPEAEQASLSRCYVCAACRRFLWEGGSRVGSFDGGSLRAVTEEEVGLGGTGIGVSGDGTQEKVQEGGGKHGEERLEDVRPGKEGEGGQGSFTGSLRELREGIRARGHGEGRRKRPGKERGRSWMDIVGGRRDRDAGRERGRSWTPPGWRRPWTPSVREWYKGDPE